MNNWLSCLPVEWGDPTQFHFHLSDIAQELVNTVDIGHQDDLKNDLYWVNEDDENGDIAQELVNAIDIGHQDDLMWLVTVCYCFEDDDANQLMVWSMMIIMIIISSEEKY